MLFPHFLLWFASQSQNASACDMYWFLHWQKITHSTQKFLDDKQNMSLIVSCTVPGVVLCVLTSSRQQQQASSFVWERKQWDIGYACTQFRQSDSHCGVTPCAYPMFSWVCGTETNQKGKIEVPKLISSGVTTFNATKLVERRRTLSSRHLLSPHYT